MLAHLPLKINLSPVVALFLWVGVKVYWYTLGLSEGKFVIRPDKVTEICTYWGTDGHQYREALANVNT